MVLEYRLSYPLVFVLIIFGIGIIGVSGILDQQVFGVSGEITTSGAGCNAPEAKWDNTRTECTFIQSFTIPSDQLLTIALV